MSLCALCSFSLGSTLLASCFYALAFFAYLLFVLQPADCSYRFSCHGDSGAGANERADKQWLGLNAPGFPFCLSDTQPYSQQENRVLLACILNRLPLSHPLLRLLLHRLRKEYWDSHRS